MAGILQINNVVALKVKGQIHPNQFYFNPPPLPRSMTCCVYKEKAIIIILKIYDSKNLPQKPSLEARTRIRRFIKVPHQQS